MLVWQVLLTQPCKIVFQEIQEFANDPKQVNKIICLWIMISLKNLNALPLWDLLFIFDKAEMFEEDIRQWIFHIHSNSQYRLQRKSSSL